MAKTATKSKTKKTTKKQEVPANVDPETGEVLDAKGFDREAYLKENRKKGVVSNSVDESADEKALEIMDKDPAPVVADQPDDDSGREAALSIVGGVTTPQLQEALKVQTEQRKLIQEFIQENLVEGIDYGKIHVVSSCPQEKQARGSCQKDYHFSKSILFKPGQEKIFSLFGITDELEKDEKAYEMLGSVQGLVAFKCIMWRGKNRVGEGRGAATLSQSQNDPNSCIKKAEKRARMDACLSLGFSAYFTQDLDDPDYKSQREMMNERAKHEAEARDRDENGFLPRDEHEPIDNQERQLLHRLITKAGFEDRDEILEFLKSNGVVDPQAMTSGEARKLIKKMQATEFLGPEKKKDDDKSDDDPESGVDDGPVVMPRKKVEEAELVVDDDLKSNTEEMYSTIGLNARGKMWFFKHVTGKPFGDFKKLTDEEWRRAYNHTMDILDSRVEVDPSHMGEKPAPVQKELV